MEFKDYKDYLGHQLSVGDYVVFAYSTSTSGRKLMYGVIESFCNRSGYICATISYRCRIGMSDRVLTDDKTMSLEKIVKVEFVDEDFVNQ